MTIFKLYAQFSQILRGMPTAIKLLNINIENSYGRFAVDFYFVAKCVYISKTVGETSKVTIQFQGL